MNWRKPIIFILLYLTGNNIPRYLKEIKKITNFSEEGIINYQDEKLKKLLLYSWKNVPYYKKILSDSKVIIDGKVYLNNFSNIPFLTKEIIRKEKQNIYSIEKRRGIYENTSGGSTGEPVRFLQDTYYEEWNKANKIFIKLDAGQDIGEKELRFWGSERDLLKGKESLKIRLINYIYNRREFNTFKMSQKDMFEYVKRWNKYDPSWVESYAQSIYELARFIERNKLKVKSPKNGILTSAGTLYPEMKNTIERVFKCSVYNRYGSREVGDMACGKDELKLFPWNHKLEIINEKNDKFGKIFVTNLNNYSMPLIRYQIGDIGKYGKKGFLEKVEGRVTSVIRNRSGKIVPGEFFIHFIGVVYNNGGIKKLQLIQKDLCNLTLKIVVGNKEDFKISKPKIESAIKKEMDGTCKINWEIVKDIPSLKNGKYEYIRSEVK